MRLAHYIHRYPPALGGSEAYFRRLSEHCVSQGDRVEIFTSNAFDLEAFWRLFAQTLCRGRELVDGVNVRRYGMVRFPGRRYVVKAVSFARPAPWWRCLFQPSSPICPRMWIDAKTLAGEFDAVHATAFPYSFPLACAWRMARAANIPFFLTPFLHIGDPSDPSDKTRKGYTSPHLAWLLREADGVFVQTPSEAEAAEALGVPANLVHLQGLGVDADDCTGGDRLAFRARHGIGPTEFVVGHLANQSWEKGTNDLLACLPLLRQLVGDFRVVLAGPTMPNYREYWANFREQHPSLAARVVELGRITDAQKRDFFASIDVFVLPSRSDSFGLVLLEAWANSVPNVAYIAGGPADLIRHKTDGVLVACDDMPGLAGAIAWLHADPARRAAMGEAGRERTIREFGWRAKLDLVRNVILASLQK